ncbi:hypothetical protein ACNHUS_01715 [Actinomycetes bacterium M1A6_2h]
MTDPVGPIDAIVAGHRQTLADIRRRVQAIDERSSRVSGAESARVPTPRIRRIMQHVNDIDAQTTVPAADATDDQRPRSWLT